MDQTDASLDSVLSAVRAALIAFGGFLASNGYGQSGLYHYVELGSGAVMIVGPAAWGVWSAIQKWRAKRTAVTQAVNATLNLAASGQVIIRSDGTALPATNATADQIVKTFSPPEPLKAT